MPTYEYGCSACGNQWEELQRITEPPIEVCPKCGKSTAQRLISAGTGFILKGGGWYSDLYSSSKSGSNKEGSNGATKSDSGATSGDSGSTKDSAGTKTETKAESKPATTGTSTTSTTPASS